MNAAFFRRHATKLIGLLSLAAIIGILCIRARGPREPTYQDRPLSYWLAHTHGAEKTEEELRVAIDHIGTNALPYLLQWIHYERPEWRDTLFQKAPESLEDLTIAGAELRADASEEALTYLGTNAITALEQLTILAGDTNAPDTAERAMSALPSIGPAGIQALFTLARDTNSPAWPHALKALGGTPLNNPFQVLKVAALGQLIADTNRPVQVGTVSLLLLGKQIEAPDVALPIVINCVTNDDTAPNMREIAITVLGRFGLRASNSLPVLTNALADPSPQVRLAATNTINAILHSGASPPIPYRPL